MKIYSRLLSNNEGTSLNKLADEFMVSKTSIVSDLDIIEKQVQKFNLSLIKDRKGTRIEGNEIDIRHALSQLASDFVQLEFEEVPSLFDNNLEYIFILLILVDKISVSSL